MNKCDCCDAKYCNHEQSEYPAICYDCVMHEKFRNPLFMLTRVLISRDIGLLSDYEFFEIHYSGILKKICQGDPLIQCLSRICQEKFDKI